jgi:hypothetical protein
MVEETKMASRISKNFNHRGSGQMAAVRMLASLLAGFMLVAVAIGFLG